MDTTTIAAGERALAAPTSLARTLRISEWICVVFFSYAAGWTLLHPLLALQERLTLLALDLAAVGILWALARRSAAASSFFLTILRDCFPAVLILLGYRQMGFFQVKGLKGLEAQFEGWDQALLRHPAVIWLVAHLSAWLPEYLEFSYFLCWPLLPLGLACLYLAGKRETADQYWASVTTALFLCYALFPFFPSAPPRLLYSNPVDPGFVPLFRQINLWMLGHYGISSSVFPSGHMAGVLAVALAVRRQLPRVGILFLVAAASIAVATVYGRYHYAADIVAGATLGLLGTLLATRLRPPRAQALIARGSPG